MRRLDSFEGQNVRVNVMCIRTPDTATQYSSINKLPQRPTAVCRGIVGSKLFAMANQRLNSR